MLVFIDESGDPGFKFVEGSSPLFVVSMVIFDTNEEAEKTSAVIAQTQSSCRIKKEFKFSSSHPAVKDAFFKAVSPFKFSVRSLVVDKKQVHSYHLQRYKKQFYNYFIRQLMEHDNGSLSDARIKIDGSGDRKFKREFASYLRKNVVQGKIKDTKFVDSEKNNLIQLADMVVGAVARAHNPNNLKDSDRWYRMLKQSGKLQDTWQFK